MKTEAEGDLAILEGILRGIGQAGIALSGGVDSMTLAVAAHRLLPGQIEMFHATSPAVPPEATERVREFARREGWTLHVFDAGEFKDSAYLENPVDRCFHCKTSLYRTITRQTEITILSGTNADDLDDFRPGLQAAAEHGVRHPFVEAGIPKSGVRAIARFLGLDDLAELPAAPCLSSRVETGLPIEGKALHLVNDVEILLRERLEAADLHPDTIRCRLRRAGVVIELDAPTLTGLAGLGEESGDPCETLRRQIAGLWRDIGHDLSVNFESYRTGSAFLKDSNGSAQDAHA